MSAPAPARRVLQGFTLIELLVAVLILGVMSALGYGAYRQARISAQVTEAAIARAREIEFGMRVLVMDLAQMAPRPVRDPLGQSRIPALHGLSGNGTSAGTANSSFLESTASTSTLHFNSDPAFKSQSFGGTDANNTIALADFTRAGWSNTGGQQRSTLQRVSYALVGDVLKRSYTTALDTVQGTQPLVQDLFGQVKTVQLRYLDGNATWQNTWPPPNLPLLEASWTRPLAVEVTIEFKDWGRVRRLVEVAG
ncbi:MAG TPA: type II secretion system minor pseudopilin GspJ [Steroidobacteraceae bacterium]|nr:type II secretion system minor pseudopilin GspJ [Steroidobacteraceae bacterium]